MDESEESMSSESWKKVDSNLALKMKPKKRSLVERELETNLTARVTSPVNIGDGTSTSRYGRARRLKPVSEMSDSRKIMLEVLKSTPPEKSPTKVQSPVYKMHASNSPIRTETVKRASVETSLENQIETIYQENISLSRFSSEETVKNSPSQKTQKIYMRKDLIQSREPDETVVLIKSIFSPIKGSQKQTNTHLSNVLERSSEKITLSTTEHSKNGFIDNSSVVKTLDFDSKKKKKENKDIKLMSKSELFELEAKCMYQVGDLAWSRMGTYPFWPCIVTRDPGTGMYVKKKLFGRIERDIIHVTFFGDNGRRGWIVDNMLRKFMGLKEFESTKDRFTPEDKKKDPRLYAAFFISEKKQTLWHTSVEEAETLLREPKRLRIELLNDILAKSRSFKITPKTQKSGKVTRTDSDVSLSESLYDTLFSEDDGKIDDGERSKNKSRNKSLDVSEVVTACLDNMAAKTGITKIQRQSHMDRWLQKAKSKTPEKSQVKTPVPKKVVDNKVSNSKRIKLHRDTKPYSLRKSPYESRNLLAHQNEHDYSKFVSDDDNSSVKTNISDGPTENKYEFVPLDESGAGIGVITKIESLAGKKEQSSVDEILKNDEVTVIGTEDAKEVLIENGVTILTETQNNQSDQSNITTVKDAEVDINYNDSNDQQSSELAILKENENAYSDTVCTETDSIINNSDSLNYSESQNVTEHPEVCNEHEMEIEKLNGDKITDNSVILIGDNLSIHENNINVDDSEMSIDHENHDVSSKSFNLCPEICRNVIEVNNINLGKEKSNDSDGGHVRIESENITANRGDNVHLDLKLLQKNNCDEVNINTEDFFLYKTENAFLHSIKSPHEDNLEDANKINVNNLLDEIRISSNNNSNLLPEANFDKANKNNINEIFYENELTKSDNSDAQFNESEGEKIELYKESTQKTCKKHTNVQKEKNEKDSIVQETNEKNSLKSYEFANNLNNSDNDTFPQEGHNKSSRNNKSIDSNNTILAKTNIEIITKEDELGNVKDTNYKKNIEMQTDQCLNINGSQETELYNLEENNDGVDTVSVNSEVSEISSSTNKGDLGLVHNKKSVKELDDPEFFKYFELRQDGVMDEHPELNEDEIINYLHQTWLYEESKKSDIKKAEDLEQSSSVKGLNEPARKKVRRVKGLIKEGNKKKSTSERKDKDSDSESESVTSESSQMSVNIDLSSKWPVVLIKRGLSLKRSKKIVMPSPIREIPDTEKVNTTVNIRRTNETTIDIRTNEEIEITEFKYGAVSHNIDENTESEITCSSLIDSNKSIVKYNLCPKILNLLSDPTSDSMVENLNESTNEIKELDDDTASIDSEASDVPLIYRKLRVRVKENGSHQIKSPELSKEESESNNDSFNSEDSEISMTRPKKKAKYDRKTMNALDDPEFKKYHELRQDSIIDENPQLTQEEVTNYLYKTWLYEESTNPGMKKTDEIAQTGIVKGLEQEKVPPLKIKIKKVKVPREITDYFEVSPKEKPKRKSVKPYYNEEYYDMEDEIECFEINKDKDCSSPIKTEINQTVQEQENYTPVGDNQDFCQEDEQEMDEVELYFSELTKPKPNIFKGLLRERVCEICEKTGNLVKCKSCHGMFHVDCVQTESKLVEISTPVRGRRKKKKAGRKPKNSDDSEGNSDDKQDISEDNNISIEEIEAESITVDAEALETQLYVKMKELLDNAEHINYDSYSSDNTLDWNDTIAGKCEIVDVELKRKSFDAYVDYSDFKCKNCIRHDTPVCFVCKSVISKKESKVRQRCHVAHCHKYYHLECLDHWPQTQFNSGEPSKNNKKINEHFEALKCPRHVCHTCVSDDPRGCKTRFSGDKLARCIRCPATYHTFTKCVPAGSVILTASHIICPRHYQHRPGKVPCHVNTGWCFICALGGSLICCEYCPTSFHAECLNIDPPEGGYMCEDCETGRLPLYGEMVWVKLGHYRWWPGLILHPAEIPNNIMAVKHTQGEFVVRFFGQYDYYWVNRGRVFPFQEGDSGRVSSQKSKIDAAFTTAMEHAQRACEILKSAMPNEEESIDIASSLLPPHYVKLKVNRPCGSLCGRKLDDPESSLTQCECNPDEEDPCGPYSQCLNRMLLTECGPSCRAGDRCNNRAFEKRLYPNLVPYRTPHRGWGLKTLEDIKAGQFVIEYVGELIDEEEFKRRMRRKHEIRDENFYFLTLDKERMIDAGPKGNLARFMNHCCEPNCETQKWTVLGDVRVGLFALNDIPANSEVTFNYNLESAGIEKKRCMCGAKRCSGYIGAKPKQDESLTKKIKVPVKRTYKKRKVEESPPTGKTKTKRLGRPPKPKELSEIEKDLLIIRNATNGLSSDESSRSLSSECDRLPKALKRKRVSFSTEEIVLFNRSESPSLKRQKYDEKEVGD